MGRMYRLLSIGVWLISVFVSGCDDPSVFEPAEPKLPASNHRIVTQAVFGNPTLTNWINEFYDYGESDFYFRGQLDDHSVVGRIDRNGQMLWTKDLSFTCRSVCVIPDDVVGLGDAIVCGGWQNSNEDDSWDAFIAIVGEDGHEIDSMVIAEGDTSFWINGVSAIDQSSFVAVGGVEIEAIDYPFAATFGIAADSSLVLKSTRIFDTIPNQFFNCVQSNPDETVGDQFKCYIAAEQEEGNAVVDVDMLSLHGAASDLGTAAIAWTLRIPHHLPIGISLDGLRLHEGVLYLAGEADVETEENPAGSEWYWNAGFVASVSTSGSLNWLTFVELSKHNDVFSGVNIANGLVYAIGEYDAFYWTADGRTHGYALISILDAQSGAEKYHLGFGAEEYESYFGAIFVDGTRAYCAGWTNHANKDLGREAWFAEVSIDSLEGFDLAEMPGFNSYNATKNDKESPRESIYHRMHDSGPPRRMFR